MIKTNGLTNINMTNNAANGKVLLHKNNTFCTICRFMTVKPRISSTPSNALIKACVLRSGQPKLTQTIKDIIWLSITAQRYCKAVSTKVYCIS